MYRSCKLCPRQCQVNREERNGACHVGAQILVARAALHMWEEPCISGRNGSGTVFFAGCSLSCVFCQNRAISRGQIGKSVSVERLADIFFELKEQGAENINLVTPDHYLPSVCDAIRKAKENGINLPFICNCSGYETVESLRMLEGLIDIYLPDFKYWESETAHRYSKAPDYPECARNAVKEMVRQVGECRFDENGMLKSGVVVRHLLLPGKVREAKQIVLYLYETYGDRVWLSLMNQYTPGEDAAVRLAGYPDLQRKVTVREYERWIRYALDLGITNAFLQEGETASESFIPPFDLEGV